MNPVDPLPEHPHLIPYLAVDDARAALDFYVRALGARELYRLVDPSGVVGHAELELGSARLMLADEHPALGHRSPRALGGSPVSLSLYVADVDAVAARAAAAGATLERAPADQFHGDRVATIRDPFGHRWSLASRVEVLTAEEIQRRFAALMVTPSAT